MSLTKELYDKIKDNFKKLDRKVPDLQMEQLSFLAFNAYEGSSRFFHDLNHIFSVADSEDPLAFFAGIFHDIVYLQVDGTLVPEVAKVLKATVIKTDKGMKITPEAGDRLALACFKIFGKTPEQTFTPFDGLNEITSALVAIDALGAFLSPKECLQIATMIEATIPFRAQSRDNDWVLQVEKRLPLAASALGLNFTHAEVKHTITQAVLMANRDVASFASTDTGLFMHGTWQLLAESNFSLRNASTYTTAEYRIALNKTLEFFFTLKPENIFHYYNETITQHSVDARISRVKQNLSVGINYLTIKTVTAMLFENIALETGGDGPMAYFAGDLADTNKEAKRIEDYLPQTQFKEPLSDLEKLLAFGRTSLVGHDIQNSPAATYIYASCGLDLFRVLIEIGSRVSAGKANRLEFFRTFPQEVFQNFIQAFKHMAPARNEGLNKILSAVTHGQAN